MRAVPTGIFCPSCGTECLLTAELCARLLLPALRLQAQRLGVWTVCEQCRASFVHRENGTEWNIADADDEAA